MAMDHNQGRRGHFHRGRRGPDRRGLDRREGAAPDPSNRPERGDRVDVEQIMRDIRARIAQRSGVELSNQQIQELAARRLEAILDPRGLKPELLDQLRRSAGERSVSVDVAPPGSAQSYPFDETTLYDSPNALLRFIRKLLQPLLRMMFNPTPIAHALALQSRLNTELAAREAERDRRQAEWNALHYQILQRLALEVSRGSIESQNLSLRVESLAAKVDFNERRVRTIEGAQVRGARPQDTPPPVQAAAGAASEGATATPSAGAVQPADAPRRRRRRRRGRRGPGVSGPIDAHINAQVPTGVETEDEEGEVDEGFDDEATHDSSAAPGSNVAPESRAQAESEFSNQAESESSAQAESIDRAHTTAPAQSSPALEQVTTVQSVLPRAESPAAPDPVRTEEGTRPLPEE